MIGVLLGDQGDSVAVAGFRVATNLSWGRHVYIYDLSTMPAARGQGFAGQPLAWVHDEASRLGCREVHLDSGVGASRFTATACTSTRATASTPTTSSGACSENDGICDIKCGGGLSGERLPATTPTVQSMLCGAFMVWL